MDVLDAAWNHITAGNDLSDEGRYEEALASYDAAAELLEQRPDPLTFATLQMEYGITLERTERHHEAREHFERALVGYLEVGTAEDVARLRQNLGNCLQNLGEHEGAVLTHRQAQDTWRLLGNERGVADCEVNIANTLTADPAHWDDALERYRSARAAYVRLGLPTEVADCDDAIGWILAERGRFDEARALQLTARSIYIEHDVVRELAHCERNLGHTELHAGNHAEAVRWLTSSRERYLELGLDGAVADVDAMLAETDHANGTD